MPEWFTDTVRRTCAGRSRGDQSTHVAVARAVADEAEKHGEIGIAENYRSLADYIERMFPDGRHAQ